MTIHSEKASLLATEHKNNKQSLEWNTLSATSEWMDSMSVSQKEFNYLHSISCLDHISNWPR